MKSITNRSYCGAISPGSLTLSVISLPNKPVKAPYCPLKRAKEKASFPLVWLCLLGGLLLCNSVMANDVSWKVMGYTGSSNWQVGFEQLTLGGQNTLFTEAVSLDSDLQESFTQEVDLYSGWGVKLGYRYALSEYLFGSIHLGSFNWDRIAFNVNKEIRQGEGDQSGISPYLAVGVEFRLSELASWSLNWQHVELNNHRFDDLAIRLAYRF